MEELAHRGDQCGFGSQAFAKPALVEALQDRVVSHSDQSRHVQGLAQPTVALLADPGLATDGGAGLVEHGIEARIAGQLPRRGVRQLVSILGQQRQGSQRPDAGDGDEQVKARPQRALCSRQGERLGLDLGELARQPVGQLAEPLDQSDRDVRVDLGLLVAIAQSVEQLAQLELVAPQGPKLERDRGGLRAGRRLERFGELQETLRIDDVGLARARCRTGEVADPPRIGQDIAHPGPALPQPSFELAPVGTGGLNHHEDPRAPRQPSAKQRQPRRVVGELLGDALALLPAGRHERRLREIHANPGDSGHLAPPCRPTSVRLQLSRGRCLPSSSRLLRLGYGPASRGRSIFLTGSTASRGSQRLIPAAPRHEPLPPRGSSTSPKILERAWGVEPSSAELWARRPQSAAPASTTGRLAQSEVRGRFYSPGPGRRVTPEAPGSEGSHEARATITASRAGGARFMIQELVHIGKFSVSPFGLMLVCAFLAAYAQLRWGMRRLGVGDEEDASALVFAGGLGGIIGAKVYYALLNWDWHVLLDRSGLVWYGGFVVGAAAVLLVARRRRLPAWPLLRAAGRGPAGAR